MDPASFRLRIFGDPVLRRRAEAITEFTPDLVDIAKRMFEVMYEAEGVGLAGPQVGLSRRIIVLDVPQEEGENFVGTLLNPRILRHEGTQKGQEGCLSVPKLREDVTRHDRLLCEAEDLEGVTFRFECSQLLARAMQHEIDHLDGMLYIDRLSPVRRKLMSGKLKKISESREEATA